MQLSESEDQPLSLPIAAVVEDGISNLATLLHLQAASGVTRVRVAGHASHRTRTSRYVRVMTKASSEQ